MILPESVTVAARSAGEAANVADSGDARFILGMSDEQYHARPEVSASGLKVLRKSPKAFQLGARKESAAFAFGHAVHGRILGVGLPVVCIPQHLLSADGGIRSNAAKDWRDKAEADGKVALKPDAYEFTVRASDAVLRHPKAGPIFERSAGVPEVSMFATLPSGLRLRGRADWMDPELVDLKTTTDLSDRKLGMVVDDFDYDLSAEMYRLLYELITGEVPQPVRLVFVEKEAPYDVRVVILGDDWISGGFQKLRTALETYERCAAAGAWPGVDEDVESGIRELTPPAWYAARVRNDEMETL